MRYIVMGVVATLFLITGAVGANDETTANTTNIPPVKRKPGMWKIDMTLVKFDAPDAPLQMKEGMERMFSSMSGKEQCITAEQIAEKDIEKNLINGATSGSECTFDRKIVAGETVDIASTCKQGTQTTNLVFKGTFGKTAQDIQIITTNLGPDGKKLMTMELQMKATRTGDCA